MPLSPAVSARRALVPLLQLDTVMGGAGEGRQPASRLPPRTGRGKTTRDDAFVFVSPRTDEGEGKSKQQRASCAGPTKNLTGQPKQWLWGKLSEGRNAFAGMKGSEEFADSAKSISGVMCHCRLARKPLPLLAGQLHES